MFFNVELPPDVYVTFRNEDKDTDLIPYYIQSQKLEAKLKERMKLEEEFKTKIGPTKRIFNGANGYWIKYKSRDLFISLYALTVTPIGYFLSNTDQMLEFKAGTWTSTTLPLLYSNPVPKDKFNRISYGYMITGMSRLNGHLYHLRHIHKYLNITGYATFHLFGSMPTDGDLAFPYLLTLFFKYVIVGIHGHCIGIGYNGTHLKETGFPFLPANIIKNYYDIRMNSLKESIILYSLGLQSDTIAFFNRLNINTMDMKLRLGEPLTEYEFTRYLTYLREFRSDPTHSIGMNMDEGNYLYNKVLETNASNILEFGLGNAIYTIYLLMAVYKTHGYVTSIDSTQTEQWNQRGVQLIDAMRLKSWHKWIDVDYFIYIKRILSQKSYKNLYTIIYINAHIYI